MRSVFRNIAILLSLVLNQGLHAYAAGGFLDNFHGLASPYVSDGKFPSNRYVSPNELNPELAKPILEKTVTGVYLTVGTERAFIAAALSPSAEHVVILDYNPNITIYNNINIELLRASYNPKMSVSDMRSRYLHLRFDADESEWIETFKNTFNNVARYCKQKRFGNNTNFGKNSISLLSSLTLIKCPAPVSWHHLKMRITSTTIGFLKKFKNWLLETRSIVSWQILEIFDLPESFLPK